MIILHQGKDASDRAQKIAARTQGAVFRSNPETPLPACAEQISQWISHTPDPALIVLDPARVNDNADRQAIESVGRMAKFSGIDVHLVGNSKMKSLADKVVKRDADLRTKYRRLDQGSAAPAAVQDQTMSPFQKTEMSIPTVQEVMALKGFPQQAAEAEVRRLKSHTVWVNNLYQVNVEPAEGGIPFAHLIIRRLDGAPVHNWQHFQTIKNELLGPECEAVELYPPEGHLVDEKDHYHLWGFTTPNETFGIGFRNGRQVKDKR